MLFEWIFTFGPAPLNTKHSYLNFISRRNIQADLVLIGLCGIWGSSFPIVKMILPEISPNPLLWFRFGIASLIFSPFIFTERNHWNFAIFRNGIGIGIFLFLGMWTQTLGLVHTSAIHSGFLTALSVLLVPVWCIFLFKKSISRRVWLASGLAVLGAYFLASSPSPLENFQVQKGNLLTLLCAVAFSFEIVLIQYFVTRDTVWTYTWVMSVTVTVLALIADMGSGTEKIHFQAFSASTWMFLGYLALVVTAFSFWAQLNFQPKTSATAAAIIYTTEPIFALIFSRILLGEQLSFQGWIGAGLIFTGIFIHELRPKRE